MALCWRYLIGCRGCVTQFMTTRSTPSLLCLLLMASSVSGCETTVTPLSQDAALSDVLADGLAAGDLGDGGVWPDATPIGQDAQQDSTVPGDALTDSDGSTKYTECDEDHECGVLEPFCAPTGLCVECKADHHCPGGVCVGGYCVTGECVPGMTQCKEADILTCDADGLGWTLVKCTGGICKNGACTGCEPGQLACDHQTILRCDDEGADFQVVGECGAGDYCVSGDCLGCYPGTQKCEGNIGQTCDINGEWVASEDCGALGKACTFGFCVSSCFDDFKSQTSSGCDYWAVDLDNHWDAQDSPYAIVVSNLTGKNSVVNVTKRESLTSETEEVQSAVVPPGGVWTFHLPPRQPETSGLTWKAYRVQASTPIIAYQFNPLDNEGVFSNDASLLLPANTFGTEHYVMSWPQLQGSGPSEGSMIPYRGYATVTAIEPNTQVTIRPTCATQAGPGVDAMLPGQDVTFTMQPYQVLNVMTDQPGGDLTGTQIMSDKPVGVYGGHTSAASSDKCCTDHLEQQLYPVHTWGTTVVAARSPVRALESDYWRVLASQDDTTITFTPGPESVVLHQGQVFQFTSLEDLLISGDKPIMVAQVLASAQEVVSTPQLAECEIDADCHEGYDCKLVDFGTLGCFPPACEIDGQLEGCPQGHTCTCFDPVTCACQPLGDPAMILVPPVAQYRSEMLFLVPDHYIVNYVVVVVSAQSNVSLDDALLPSDTFAPLGETGYVVARIPIEAGVHHLVSTAPAGVTVIGYDKDVSYGYPAGLNLSEL